MTLLPMGGGTLVIPPRIVTFQLQDGNHAALWLILDSPGGNTYVVFYDAETGRYGLGSRNGRGECTYIGDYGPLWTTLMGM